MNVIRDLLATGYPAEIIISVLAQERLVSENSDRNGPCLCGSGKNTRNAADGKPSHFGGEFMYLHKLIFQFKILVDHKTFIAAAEKLCISQPTLTQNIKRLEIAIEVSLLIRGSRGVSLTVYGESLYQHACLLDRNYKQALLDIDTIKRNHRQALVLECGHAGSHGGLFAAGISAAANQ